MVGTNILQAAAISPKVFYSGQLSATDISIYQPASGSSARVFQGLICNSTSSQAPPTLSTGPIYNTIVAPTLALGTTSSTGGTFSSGTYYWEITATTAVGETTVSNEVHATISANGSQVLTWGVVGGSNGYKIYRGTAASGENVLVTTITSGSTTSYLDTGLSGTSATPPVSNTSGGGSFAASTYYWVVSAVSASGETIASNEITNTFTAVNGSIVLTWTTITAASSYHLYRGTSSGAENHVIATVAAGTTTYTDTGTTGTSLSPLTSSTFGCPVTVYLSVIQSGNSLGPQYRAIQAFPLAVNDTLNLTPYFNGLMLGPGDYISGYASLAGAAVLILSGTVHT